MKTTLTLLLTLCITMMVNAQWFWQNPLPQGNHLNSVKFIDSNTGCAVGDDGTILKTTNGGIPVELLSFIASLTSNEVELKWTTASEINNKGFDIERKSENEEWYKIGHINGKGTILLR